MIQAFEGHPLGGSVATSSHLSAVSRGLLEARCRSNLGAILEAILVVILGPSPPLQLAAGGARPDPGGVGSGGEGQPPPWRGRAGSFWRSWCAQPPTVGSRRVGDPAACVQG